MDGPDDVFVCPECSYPMSAMGTAFRAPKQSNIKQWQKVKLLIGAGFNFTRYSGPMPQQLEDVPAFLEKHRQMQLTPGERLLEKLQQEPKKPKAPGLKLWETRSKQPWRIQSFLNPDGRRCFTLGGWELSKWSTVLIKINGKWQQGIFKWTTDDGENNGPYVEMGTLVDTAKERVFITPSTLLRWPN
jgi:hypothetical protein